MNGLYTEGGEKFNTTSSGFERGIRHALDTRIRKNIALTPLAAELFGNRIAYVNISSKAFIATIAAEVKKRKKRMTGGSV